MLILTVIQYLLFGFCLYYLFFACAGFFHRRRRREHPPCMRFAVIIPAHNEAGVIGKLVGNLHELDYPRTLYDIYVVADNCSDDTARVAREAGAVVWERFDRRMPGKGSVLQYAIGRLGFGPGSIPYDAAVFFDADNLVAPNFLRVMNNRLLEGEKLIQSFIDAKNPNDNWVTSVYSLNFWLHNRFVLLARYNLGFNAVLLGTGMCIAGEVLAELGWNTQTLTEDMEYSVQALLRGYRTCFALETRVFDEKPLSFIASCRQRLRWARGQINVAARYAPRLLGGGLRSGNPAQLELGLRLLQLFIVAAGGLLALLSLAWPEQVLATSPYYRLGQIHPGLAIFLSAFPYILPLAALPLDRLPLKPFRYYVIYPLLYFSWVLIIIFALFTFWNRHWMPTAHSRALDYRHLPVKKLQYNYRHRSAG